MKKEYYLRLRKQFFPDILNTIFVLESPPASGKYFYNERGNITEPLFKAMMTLTEIKATTKIDGLLLFQKKGYCIVDATYTPVNHLKGKKREQTILHDYNNLITDLNDLSNSKKPDIILIKANICRLLEQRLLKDGFNIKNNGVVIPFPSTGQQNNFADSIKKCL